MNSQMKYYGEHREEIKKKMRERAAKRREEEKALYESNPVAAEQARQRYNTYYRGRIARRNKEAIEQLLKESKEDFRPRLELILREETYKGMNVSDLRTLRFLATV
jgi:hypothetical protein